MNLLRSLETLRTRQGWSGVLRMFGTALVAIIGVVALVSSWPSSPRSASLDSSGPWTVPVTGEWTPRVVGDSYAAFDDGRSLEFEDHVLPLDPPPWEEEHSFGTEPPISWEERAEGEEAGEVAPPTTREYIVRRNDSFWRIADRELGSGLRHEEILDWNPKLRGKTLHAGMAIVLPVESSARAQDAAPEEPRVTPPRRPPIPRSHVVERGENLTKIARLYGVTPEAIFESNRSRLRSIDHVPVGKKLTIPTPPGTETRGVSGRGVRGRGVTERGAMERGAMERGAMERGARGTG